MLCVHRIHAGAVATLGGGTMVLMSACALGLSDSDLKLLRDGFESRRDAMFGSLAGKPLRIAEKRPPLAPDRTLYTRHYSFSIMSFAMTAFWLGEQVEAANAALAENCRYYLADQKARDDRDSFYWSADLLCRIVEFFGSNGTRSPGRLSASTEALIYEMMFAYCQNNSRLIDAEFEKSLTWHIHESENHHIQGFSTVWQFAKLLDRSPVHRDGVFDDGGTPAQHCRAWTAYSREYLRERVRKGLFVESANKGYGVMTLKCIYNLHDFAADSELRDLAAAVLDVYWATWAEEQINGVRGGGASRVYQGRMSQVRDTATEIGATC